jgi:hypothetical protein
MKCEFCNKEFKREKSLDRHMCEKKRRWENKFTPEGQLAFELFSRFKKHYGFKSKKAPLEEFLTSSQYKAYETLAKFFIQLNPLDINEYFSHLVHSNAPFRKWISAENYNKWVRHKLLTEDADTAVTRSIETISSYATENKLELDQVYDNLTGNRLYLWLTSGRVSPWFIILSSKTDRLLEKLDSDMLTSTKDLLNPLVWRIKVQNSPTAQTIKHELKAADL